MLFKLVKTVSALFGEVTEGFSEDRTGNIMRRVQCKMIT